MPRLSRCWRGSSCRSSRGCLHAGSSRKLTNSQPSCDTMNSMGHRIRKPILRCICLTALSAVTTYGADIESSSPPPYKQLRYDEDYRYLRDPSQRTDFMDAAKYLLLNPQGDWYVTLGGEVRERYEYFHNSNWGAGPQDHDGYLLQRYMIHADAHFTDHFRIFTQFKSGLEDGRTGGPRPTAEDQLE